MKRIFIFLICLPLILFLLVLTWFWLAKGDALGIKVRSEDSREYVWVVNPSALTQWLAKLGYSKKNSPVMVKPFGIVNVIEIKSLRVVYTDKQQDQYYVSNGKEVVVSAGFNYDENSKELEIKVNVVKGKDVTSAEYIRGLEYTMLDILYRINTTSSIDDSIADNVWRKEFLRNKRNKFLLVLKNPLSWIVQTVYADCSGSFRCGTMQLVCVGDVGPCDYSGQTCGDNGTCAPQCMSPQSSDTCFGVSPKASCDVYAQSECSSPVDPSLCLYSGTCNWVVNPTETPPPGCTYGGWVDGACGNGSNGCNIGKRNQTRWVDPPGCVTDHRCVTDAACGSATPYPTPVCSSWTNFFLHNGGSAGACTPLDSYNDYLPQCDAQNGATVIIQTSGVLNATQMQLANVSPETLSCTDSSIVWPTPRAYTGDVIISGWSLAPGAGDRKVCGRFTNPDWDIECGGMLHVFTPMPTVHVRGDKVAEPGGIENDPNLTGLNICLSSPASCSNTQPYDILYTPSPYPTQGQTNRNVTAPAAPAGYALMGYTRCYNSYGCHSWPANSPTPGPAGVSDWSVLNENFDAGDPYHYASIWWHYCSPQAPPSNIVPNASSPPMCSGNTVISWTPPAGTPPAYYALRVDDQTNGWVGNCAATQNAGDYCLNNVAGSSATVNLNCNHPYHIWVHAANSCNSWSWPATEAYLTAGQIGCIPAQPSNVSAGCRIDDIMVYWRDNSNNENIFYIYATPAPRGPQRTAPADATSYEDNMPFDPPVDFYYCVSAANTNNPAACRESVAKCSIKYDACVPYQSWFQTQGGDVAAAGGVLQASLPTPQPSEYPTPVLIYQGEPILNPNPTGMPGIAFGAGFGGNLTPQNISSRNWMVDIQTAGWSSLLTKQENQYTSIHDRILARVGAFQLKDTYHPDDPVSLGGNDLNQIIDAVPTEDKRFFDFGHGAYEVAILEANVQVTLGEVSDPLTTLGTRKAVLLVNKGQVFINSNILSANNPTGNPATMGFLAIIAKDDVTVASTVVVPTPAPTGMPYQHNIAAPSFPAMISGIIYTEGDFLTPGSTQSQLKIDGSIVAMGNVDLSGRKSKGPYPAVFVHYNPGMARILRDVGLRRKIVMESMP